MSPKREEFIKFLLEVRVATKKQLAVGLYQLDTTAKDFEEELKKKLSALSLRVSELQKANLIVSFVPRSEIYQRNSERVFTLSSEGYDYVTKEVIGLKDKVGTGFNDDLGSFDYSLYRPGVNHVLHTLLQTDVHIVMKNLKSVSNRKLDYRNNLYAAKPYDTGDVRMGRSSRRVFRPDGEVLITVKEQREYDLLIDETNLDIPVTTDDDPENLINKELRYFVEIDTGSERGIHLKKKAQQYEDFFSYLKSQGQTIPDGVIFVTKDKAKTETGFNIKKEERFQSIYKCFKELAEDSAGENSFDVIYLEVQELSQYLQLLMVPVGEKQRIAWKSVGFLGDELSANIHSVIEESGGPEYKFELTPVTHRGNRKITHWLFINADGMQSTPWNRAIESFKRLKRPEYTGLEKVDIHVKIIFYYVNAYSTLPVSIDDIKRTPNFAPLIDSIYFLDITKDKADSWHDVYYNKLSNIQNTGLTKVT